METFLQMVAQDLYAKTGNDLSHTAVVFPNKRARLFFNKQLAAQSTRPIWSPAYLDISDLFRQLSPLEAGDTVRLVCELYQVYGEITGSKETLDDFYFWGELLVSDFDDVDKNLVDAGKLFLNLQALKDIMAGNGFLDEAQEEAIRHFFRNFSVERQTELKAKFLSVWDKLGDIYRRFQTVLEEQGIAYEGMMYRRVLESPAAARFDYDRYVFVGFNALNRVEEELFKRLQAADKALFYWDYDTFYTEGAEADGPVVPHEAGSFIRHNLTLFPNQLPQERFDALRNPKEIRYLCSPTENAQARYLQRWVKDIRAKEGAQAAPLGEETAVVLCNESLLLPVLHSIPEEVEKVNITMGFPLAQTPVYGYLNAAVALQTTGYRKETGCYACDAVLTLLRHPYTRRISTEAKALEKELMKGSRFYPAPGELQRDDFLRLLFTPQEGTAALCRYLTGLLREVGALYCREDDSGERTGAETDGNGNGRATGKQNSIYNQLYSESLFKAYTLVNRLLNLAETGKLSLQTITFTRLLDRLLAATNIPFHGEPAVGMQIMGVLETRNLDFRNLLVLSLNEGKLPRSGTDASFIPYNLRKAFGMTTIDRRNSVYAYYFYRLIQRAEHITLAYNTSTEGVNRGEMSRFMLQLLMEWGHPVVRESLEAEHTPRQGTSTVKEKTPEALRQLYNKYDTRQRKEAYFSPSALNTYLDCRLKFYYRYVAGLKPVEEVTDEIDSALFGTLFHDSAQFVYQDLTRHGKEIRKEDLERLLKDKRKLDVYVKRAFNKDFFHVGEDENPVYNGTQLILSKAIHTYLHRLVQMDLAYAPFSMEAMEKDTFYAVKITTPSGELPLAVGGRVDRMDSKEGKLRIVDYKTGGEPKPAESIAQLFTPSEKRPGYIFQTFLYASILCRRQPLEVMPSLLYIHKASSPDYSPVIEMKTVGRGKAPVTDFSLYETEFRERLVQLLQEIYNPNEPFTQTEFNSRCAYCDFKRLCKR